MPTVAYKVEGGGAKVRSAATTAVIAAIALMTAPIAMASAGDDAHQVIGDVGSIAAGVTGSDSVQCPPGERALSGGVGAGTGATISIGGPLDDTGSFSLTTTGDVPRYWYTAMNNPNPYPVATNFDAVCSASSDATIQATTFTLTGPAAASATAACPSGQRVVGGGVGTNGTVNSYLLADQPESLPHAQFSQMRDGDVPIDWYGYVENTAGTHTYEVYALCSPTSTATLQVTPFQVGSGGSDAYADCPGEERALSGGFGVGGAGAGATASLSAPIGKVNTQTGIVVPFRWEAFLTAAPGTTYNYAVFALCEGPSSPSSPPAAAPTGQQAAALTKCKKKHGKARRKCQRKANLLPVLIGSRPSGRPLVTAIRG